jgi:hypothetical protein
MAEVDSFQLAVDAIREAGSYFGSDEVEVQARLQRLYTITAEERNKLKVEETSFYGAWGVDNNKLM